MHKYYGHMVVDTPNVIFYNQRRGKEQCRNNILALIKLLSNIVLLAIVIITPKMMKEFPNETNFLISVIETMDGKIVFSGHQDPDEVALNLALQYQAPILTNDKFRQNKYSRYEKIKHKVIRFRIILNKLCPIKGYWKKYMEGSLL